MEVSELAPGIFELKMVDFSFRKMHTFQTPSGTSFNAYLVVGAEDAALIDTVPRERAAELVQALRGQLGAGTLRYVVVDHAEPDAAGSLREVLGAYPAAQLICTRKCVEVLQLQQLLPADFINYEAADARLAVPLGRYTLKFAPTPLLHWQEQMCTYVDEPEIYFSSDLYGQNLAATEVFADQIDRTALQQEGKAYLCQVFGGLRAQLKKAHEITAIAQMVCPQHGLVLRDQPLALFRQFYQDFHENRHVVNKICIIYYSMYGSTAKMAQLMADGIRVAGGQGVILDLNQASITDCVVHAFESRAVCIGSPTLNFGCMPQVAEVLAQFQASGVLSGKKAVVFGAFGWSAGGAKEIAEMLAACGCAVVRQVGWRLSADQKDMDAIQQAGKELCEGDVEQ